jgi:hypothetical protein
MIVLKNTIENLGDTKNAKGIVKNNRDKWLAIMPASMVKKIEMISYEMLRRLDYPIILAKSPKKLNNFEIALGRASDAWNRFRFDCVFQGGFKKALIYQYKKRKYG